MVCPQFLPLMYSNEIFLVLDVVPECNYLSYRPVAQNYNTPGIYRELLQVVKQVRQLPGLITACVKAFRYEPGY